MVNSSNENDVEQSDTEMWRNYRQHSQEKRAANREASARILTEAGVSFAPRNMGAHLMVSHNGKLVNFWPGTGKWIAAKAKGRGVHSLLRHLGVKR